MWLRDYLLQVKVNRMKLLSVNNTTVHIALEEALHYIREVLLRIILAIANARDDIPVLLSKADIKDGF